MIFGTYADDTLALADYRLRHRGLQHGRRLTPALPRPDEPTVVHLTVGADVAFRDLRLFYTIDGSDPSERSLSLPFVRKAVAWDSLLWGYREAWEAEVPPLPEGTLVRYRIRGVEMSGRVRWADWPPPDRMLLEATFAHFSSPRIEGEWPEPEVPPTFAFRIRAKVEVPAWAREARIYQIFVDRFHPGPGRAFLPPGDDPHGRRGGTLRGVLHRLDDLAALGFNALWLSPIFPSPTAHGYDATDYFAIEPALGTMEDFHALAEAVHARGMRLILDLALNHLSDRHPFFVDARSSSRSQYRHWFVFDRRYPPGYRAYFHLPTMPEWNLNEPAVRRHLVEVGRFWLEQGADGFRLDYADGLGPTFWLEFTEAARAVKADAWCFGEIVQPPPKIAPYRGVLGGALDFVWADAVRESLAYARRPLPALVRFLERHRATFHADFLQPAFLDNHDMDRFLYAAAGDTRRLRMGLLLLALWPQPIIVYYGTERGLMQTESAEKIGLHASRVVLGDRVDDASLAEALHHLLNVRREHPALLYGEEGTLYLDEKSWLTERRGSGRRYLLAFHVGGEPRTLPLPQGMGLLHPLATFGVLAESGALHLQPWSAGVWEVDEGGEGLPLP